MNTVAAALAAPKRKYIRKNAPAAAPAQPVHEVIAAASEVTGSTLRTEVLEQFKSGLPKSDVLMNAIKYNTQQTEQVSNDDILAMVEELFATLETEMSDESLLAKLADDLIILFNDDLAEPYFFCEGIPFRAPSRYVEKLLKYRFYKLKHHMPENIDVRNVFDILESKARFDSPKVQMFNRVAKHDGALYYDLCDKRFLKITATNWEIVPAFPLFRRYKHQQVQVEPVPGGDPWELFNFLTIPEENQLLLMVFLISLFVADIVHPVLAIFGDQGAAKSFLCSILNRVIDPTLTEKIIQPKNERDLIQTFRQRYVTVLDNMSLITPRVSDILCQVCTGGGISYRQLYTDEGENIAQFRHVVIINSIRLPIVNADLMDRAIIFKLQRPNSVKRTTEENTWREFHLAKPSILGGILDTLVKAMAIYPTVKIDKLPRLADFAKWGYAIAEALGKGGDQFLEDFAQNVKRQNESVAEKNVLCQAVIGLMEDKKTHLNSVAEIHKDLKRVVGEDAKDETFPKLPHNMREKLDTLRSTLQEHGISFLFLSRDKKNVKILFENTSASAPTEPAPPAPVSPLSLPRVIQQATPATPMRAANYLESGTGVPDVSGVPENELPTYDFGEV